MEFKQPDQDILKNILKTQTILYKHFKGDIYALLCVSTCTETNKLLVTYKHIKSGNLWTRPIDDFVSYTTGEDGNRMPKFEEIGYV